MSRRRATLRDVAAAAGVSTATASRALGDYGSVGHGTRSRVLEAASELGYRRNELARSMITGRTRSIGLVLGDIENPFFSTIARAIIDAGHRRGYDTLVTNTDEDLDAERTAVHVLQEKRVDGLIVAPVYSTDSGHLVEATQRGTPLVVINGTIPGTPVDCIIGDNVAGAGDAVDHLLALGHRDIAILARSPGTTGAMGAPPVDSQSGSERVEGYRRSLERAGVPLNPAYQRGGGLRITDAELAMSALLALPRPPTAVVTTNSVILLGALNAIRAWGLRVPDDISLINFDDPPWAPHVAPALTTVEQPTRRMGELALELLLRLLSRDGHDPQVHRLPTRMHLRDSTGPANR